MAVKKKCEEFYELTFIDGVPNLFHNGNKINEMVTRVYLDVPARGYPILKIEALDIKHHKEIKISREIPVSEMKATISY